MYFLGNRTLFFKYMNVFELATIMYFFNYTAVVHAIQHSYTGTINFFTVHEVFRFGRLAPHDYMVCILEFCTIHWLWIYKSDTGEPNDWSWVVYEPLAPAKAVLFLEGFILLSLALH